MSSQPGRAIVRHVPQSYAAHYQSIGRHVSASLAEAQHTSYIAALSAAGLHVEFVPADEDRYDCVFIEDTAIVWQSHVLITNMHPKREREQPPVELALKASHQVVKPSSSALIEGGDVLHIGDTTYVGLTSRTNEKGVAALQEFLGEFGQRVVAVPVSECLHLKTAATYLGNGVLLAAPKLVDISYFDVEAVMFTDETEPGCANCLRVGEHLLMPEGYPHTAKRIQAFADEHAIQITTLNISEFEKGDGSLTCLSLIW